MGLDKRPIQGRLIMDLVGPQMTSEEAEMLQHPLVAGVILFARNCEHAQQLKSLIGSIRKQAKRPLLLSVDQEGGRVQRLKHIIGLFPAARILAAKIEEQPQQCLSEIRLLSWLMAQEMLELGFDLGFSPVVDLDARSDGVIADRAWHHRHEYVSAMASAWMHGARSAGMASVAKHFPGHGGTGVDSHLDLPIDVRTETAMWHNDLLPYRYLIAEGLPAVMTAHVVFPQINEQPATLSRYWLCEVLRKKMGFNGVIFSDDLSMGALARSSLSIAEDRAADALDAGVDFILACNNPSLQAKVLDGLKPSFDPLLEARVRRLFAKSLFAKSKAHSAEYPRWLRHRAQELMQCYHRLGDFGD